MCFNSSGNLVNFEKNASTVAPPAEIAGPIVDDDVECNMLGAMLSSLVITSRNMETGGSVQTIGIKIDKVIKNKNFA